MLLKPSLPKARGAITAAAATLTLLLGACATPGGPATTVGPSSAPATAKPAAAQPKPVEVPEAEDVMGMREAQVRKTMGEPTLERAERGARLWQYQAETCVLFLFLYETPGEGWRVEHIEASRRDAAALTQSQNLDPARELQDCLRDVVTEYARGTRVGS